MVVLCVNVSENMVVIGMGAAFEPRDPPNLSPKV